MEDLKEMFEARKAFALQVQRLLKPTGLVRLTRDPDCSWFEGRVLVLPLRVRFVEENSEAFACYCCSCCNRNSEVVDFELSDELQHDLQLVQGPVDCYHDDVHYCSECDFEIECSDAA